MKKAVVYILILVFALAALTACSANGTTDLEPETTAGTNASASPAVVTPDPDDGMVQDEDGIITDDDTGSLNTPDTDMQHRGTENTNGSVASSALPAGTPDGNGNGSGSNGGTGGNSGNRNNSGNGSGNGSGSGNGNM